MGDAPHTDASYREEEHLAEAVRLLGELVEQHPADPNYRHMLALCHRERRPSPEHFGEPPPDDGIGQAIEILEQLAQDFPDVPDYRYDLSETYAMIDVHGPPRPQLSRQVIEQRLRKALALSESLATEYPHVPHYAASHAHIYHKLGLLLLHSGRLSEAEQSCRKSVELQSDLVDRFPRDSSHAIWLGTFQHSLARVLLRRRQFGEARSLLEDTSAKLSATLAADPQLWFLHGLLERIHMDLAVALRQLGERSLAQDATRQAEDHRMEMRGDPLGGPDAGPPPRRD